MVKAINDVFPGKIGVNKAAKQYDVPATTLKDRISARVKHGIKFGLQLGLPT